MCSLSEFGQIRTRFPRKPGQTSQRGGRKYPLQDPEDHWATPETEDITVFDQLDDDDWVDAPPHWGRLTDGSTWVSLG